MRTEHTLTPWRISSNYGTAHHIVKDAGGIVARCDADDREQREADAAHIVLCVNSHTALVDALNAFAHHFGPLEDNIMLNDACRATFAKARAALALATPKDK